MVKLWMTVLAIAVAACPIALQAQTTETGSATKAAADIVANASGALAIISYVVADELENSFVSGEAICIDPSGVFMTLAIGTRVRPNALKDFTLTVPGVGGKTLKAELLGLDPVSGIGFVRATEPAKWSVVKFARKAAVTPGQEVYSVGLMSGDLGGVPYLGIARVSAQLRIPGDMVYVTGGSLTNIGSPVFAADGRAIGIVGQQLFVNYQMATERGPAGVRMHGQQETSFFLPVDEFANVLESLPTGGKIARLPWIGATRFEVVSRDLAETLKLDRPGVMIDQVVPDGPGAAAGLQNRNIVVAMNGKPLEQMASPDLIVQNFVRNLVRLPMGSKVIFTVLRGTKTEEVTITLSPMPTQPYEADRYLCRELAFAVRDKVMLDQYIDANPALKADGVIVAFIVQDRAAHAGGLQPNDVVTSVNDQPIKDVATFKQVMEGALRNKPTQAVNLLVKRGEKVEALSLQPPVPQPQPQR
jgi:serine protease Do